MLPIPIHQPTLQELAQMRMHLGMHAHYLGQMALAVRDRQHLALARLDNATAQLASVRRGDADRRILRLRVRLCLDFSRFGTG